jgi:hypothetical protein
MTRHWTRQELEQLFTDAGSRAERAAAVRHLLAGCEWCAGIARRAACGPTGVDYGQVIDRVIAKLPEMAAQVGQWPSSIEDPTRAHHGRGGD